MVIHDQDGVDDDDVEEKRLDNYKSNPPKVQFDLMITLRLVVTRHITQSLISESVV